MGQTYSVTGALLSYLVPGLGQIVQGRAGKGLLFLVCLLGLFHVGEAMGNWQNVYLPHGDNRDGDNPLQSVVNNRWHYAGQFWIGVAAWPAIWQFYKAPPPGHMGFAADREMKTFWQNYQRQPDETEVNTFLVNSDKTPDLGWIYTVIAGMLNILVIYDAFAGPAYGIRMPDGKPKTPAEEAAPK
ncbi:MAG: hypothetical protein HY040_14220 [Planctomycetes bacterium]|nr:hypothetical protein [Planctomycetota bacterium]